MLAIGMSGLSYMTGSPDRPPVKLSIDQAYAIAGSYAAMGAMIGMSDEEFVELLADGVFE